MRIGFINPSSDYLMDPFRGDPHTHFHILTLLDDHFGGKITTELIDLRGIKKEFAQYHIPECDVYLQSLYTLDYDEQEATALMLRKRYPKAKHIAGGPHAMMFHEHCSQIFDALVFGEGEESIVQAIQDLMDGKLEKTYRQTGPVNINRYPFPRRHYLAQTSVSRPGLLAMKTRKGFEKIPGATAVFSRGCPFRCHFCSMPQTKTLSLGVRYRDPKSIEAEIEYLKKDFGVQALNLHDEICIPLARDRARAHLEAIGRTNVVWRGQCRVDGITAETVSLAKQSGCMALSMGVESISQTSLDLINKKIKLEQAEQSIRLIKEGGLESRIYMILGLPGEPPDVLEQTWSFIQRTQPDLVYLSIFTLRPGTEVYNHPERYGIKAVDYDWGNTQHMYGRYGDEAPRVNFEYEEGKGPSKERILSNYAELQRRLREASLSAAI